MQDRKYVFFFIVLTVEWTLFKVVELEQVTTIFLFISQHLFTDVITQLGVKLPEALLLFPDSLVNYRAMCLTRMPK